MLILTEKPSVASAFAAALGVPRKGAYWENSEYCIVNAIGHVLSSYDPEDYDPTLKKWTRESLPMIPDTVQYKPIEQTKDQLNVIKKCFAMHMDEPFLLATDAEREGEVIGWEILDYVGFNNLPNARRFWVSQALTKEVVLEGMKNARPLAEYLSYKHEGFARQHADWLVGMNLTRLVSLQSGKLLTFGRVQTAVLAAVYEREYSIIHFVPEPYLELHAVLDAGNPITVRLFNQSNTDFPYRFSPGSELFKKVSAAEDSLKTGTITKITKVKKNIHPPQLFNLTALQKEGFKHFSYSPEQTLTIAQSLYEKHKCLSYPRTPSHVMGDDNVDLVKEKYDMLAALFPAMADGTIETLITKTNKRVFNSAELKDHHALIPLAPCPAEATKEEKNVFSLVLNQFFTLFKPDYIYNAVSIDVDINGLPFQGSGIEILQRGFKTANDDDEEQEEDYSALEEAKAYPVSSISAKEKQTEPQKHYTYETLLRLMENPRDTEGKQLVGLGQQATRGIILKKLFDRKYLSLKGKSIIITNEGTFLIENIKKNEGLAKFVSIPETTCWEEELQTDTEKFLDNVKTFVREIVSHTSIDRFQEEKKSLGPCPLCGKDIYEGKKSYYCAGYKEEGCSFGIWKEIAGATITAADAKILLSHKKTKIKKCSSQKTGKEFQAAFFIAEGKVQMEFTK